MGQSSNVIAYRPFLNERKKRESENKKSKALVIDAIKQVKLSNDTGYITQAQIEELERMFNLPKGLSNSKSKNCDLVEASRVDEIFFIG